MTRLGARAYAALVESCVSSGRKVGVCGLLILVGASLIAAACRLLEIRQALSLVTCRLATVIGRLRVATSALVATLGVTITKLGSLIAVLRPGIAAV